MTSRHTRRPTSSPRLRRTAAPVLALCVLGVLSACSDGPDPEPVAEALAAALIANDLSSVPVSGDPAVAQASLAAATAGLGGLRPSVRVSGVDRVEDTDRATADLELTWDLGRDGGELWSYRSQAELALTDDAWRVVWAENVVEPSLQPGERLVLRTLRPARGEVIGDGGKVLVTDRGVARFGIDKSKIPAEQAIASAQALAALVDIDEQAYAGRVEAAGPVAFVEALVLRTEETVEYDDDRFAAIPGAVSLPDEIPLAPTRTFARPVLGAVGEATAEIVEASEGRLQPGDIAGLSGLQAARDESLRGMPGYKVEARPAAGTPGSTRVLTEREPVNGAPLAVTLNSNLQQLAETVLEPVEPPSALVAIRPSSGEVLVAASGPGSGGYSTATAGRYAPGSTFKIVTALGLLRGGLTPETAVPCTSTVLAAGRSFKNYSDYPEGGTGDIPLRTAIANSCNTALIASRGSVPQAALTDAAAALGLGREGTLGVPNFLGSVPRNVGETEHAASMIGQGKVEASPLAMATVAASVAAGRTVTPWLLTDEPAPQTGGQLTDQEGQTLQTMLRGVVEQGSARFLADVPGAPVGAKTGTAEYGNENPPQTHAWMIGVQGDLAVAVFVEQGVSGSRTAGPLLEEFLRGAARS